MDTTSGCAPLAVNFTDLSTAGTGNIVSWAWDFGDGTVDTSQNTTHIYATTGDYSVTLVVTDEFGCRNALTRNDLISITEIATVDFSATPTSGCAAPLDVNFTASVAPAGAYTYLWNFGDGSTSTGENPSHTYLADGSYTVSLTVIDANGCQEFIEKDQFVVIDNPVAAFTALDTTVCAGQFVQFVNQSTGATNYTWSFGNGTSTTDVNPVISFAAPGTYSVTLNAINSAGCNDILAQNAYITVYPAPAPSFVAQPSNTSCDSPMFVSFVDNSIGNIIAWEWDFGNGHLSSSATPTTTYLNEGLYTVSLTVTTSDGCQATETIPNYIQLSKPQVNFAPSVTEGCAPLGVGFTNLSTSTTDPIATYLWNFGDGNTSNQANPFHTFVNSGSYDVSLTVVTQGGCTETMVYSQVTVGDTPVASFVANPLVACVGQDVAFSSNSVGNPLGYFWSFGDGGDAFTTNPVHTYQDTGTFSVLLLVNNLGCWDTLYRENYIRVVGAVAGFDPTPDNGCNPPTPVQFADNSINASTWYWDFGDGNIDSVPSPTHVYNSVGTFLVTQVVTDTVTGCTDQATFNIDITAPNAAFSYNLDYGCAPFDLTLTNTSTDANAYLWDFGDGATSTDENPTHTYITPGDYTLTLYASDGTCTDTLVLDSVITVAGPEANFNASDLTGCAPLSTTFSDLSVNNPGAPIVNWQWSFGDGNNGSGPNPGNTYTSAGNYDVRLIVLDADGCVDTVTKTSYIQPTFPTAAFTTTDSTSCPGALISFVNLSSGQGISYNWNFGDGTSSTAPNPFHLYPNNGDYTVTLAVTDANGCTDTEVKSNYVSISQPIANFAADTTSATCPPLTVSFTDLSNAVGGSIVSWLWDFGDGSTSTLPNPQKIFNTGGNYTVTLIVATSEGCRDTLTQADLIQINGPSGSFSMTPIEGCQPLDVNFSVNSPDTAWTYTWDFGDGTGGIGTNVTHTYQTDTTITPLMLVEDNLGCVVAVRSTTPVIIRPLPNVNFIVNQNEICLGESISLTNQTTSERPIVNYEWDFGDGNTSTLSNPSHVYTDTGTFYIRLRAYTLDGCTDTATVPQVIRVSSPPTAAFTPSPDAGCNPSTISFLEASSGYFPIADWAWNFGDGVGGNGQFVAPHTYTSSGVYTASLTVTDTRGCTGTTSETVTIYPLPQPDFSAFRYGCAPISVSFTDLTSGFATVTAWEWDFGDGLTSTDQNPTHIYANDGLYTVTLTVTDANGCQQSIVKNDYIRLSRPRAIFTSNAGVSCPPQAVQFTDLSISDTTISYSWNFGDGSPLSNQANPLHTYFGADTFDVRLIVTNLFGCSDTVTRPQHVITQDPPNSSFTVSDSAVCVPANIVFTSTSSGNDGASVVAFQWDFGTGSGANSASTSFAYTNPGTYTASLVAIDDNGCRDTSYKNITIFPNPNVDFIAGDTVGCSVTSIQFTDLTSGTFLPVSWNWDFGDGTNGTGQNPVHTYFTDGTYTVSLTATDVNGCSASEVKTNYIVLDHPNAAFSSSGLNGCPGTTFTFTDNSSSIQSIASWSWDFGDGSPLGTAQNPNHLYTSPGNYTVSLVITDILGCTDTISQTIPIEIYSPPAPNFTYTPNRGCEPLEVSFTNTTTAGSGTIVSMYWEFGDGNASGALNPTHTYTQAGNYTVNLIVLDDNGCQDTLSQDVEVLEIPDPGFLATPTEGCAPQVVRFIDTTSAAATLVGWEWDFGDGNTATGSQPLHTYTADGIYDVKLVVTDINGCRDSLTKSNYIRLAHPVADFSLDKAVVCPNEPIGVTFTDSTIHDKTIINWSWDFGDGNTASGQVVNHSYSNPGTYTITLTVTDVLGCSDVHTEVNVISVRNAPSVAFGISDSANCTPLTAQLTDLSTPGDGAIVGWNWDFGNGDGSLQQNPLYTWSQAGVYTVELQVTDVNGCINTGSRSVEAFAIPVSDFEASDTVGCGPATITFTNLSTTSYPVSLRKWYFGDGDSAINIINPTHTYQADGNYTVTLITVDLNGCVDTMVKSDYIRLTHPVAQFTFDQAQVCPNIPVGVNFTDQSIADHPLAAWNWDFGDGTTSSQQNPSHSYSSAGSYQVILEVTNVLGCSDSDTFPTSITVLNPPVAAFQSNDSADCTPFSTSLTDISVAGDAAINTWRWDFGDGNTSFLQNPSHTYVNHGVFTAELLITDANGCQDSVSLDLESYELPQPDFVANDSLGCSGLSFTFTDRTTSPYLLTNWLWDFGDGNTSTLRNPNHTYMAEGSYTVTLTVTDENGCSRSLIKNNYINLTRPQAEFTSDLTETCPGTDISFSDLSTPDHPLTNWEWNFGDGTTSTAQNPVHAYANPGIYAVSLVVTNIYGCTDTIVKNNYIRVLNGPTPQFTMSDSAGCSPLTVNFTSTSVGNGASIVALRWDFGNGDSAISSTPTGIFNASGIYTVNLTVTDANGCEATTSRNVEVFDNPTSAFFALNNSGCPPLAVSFSSTSSGPAALASFEWDFGDGNTSNLAAPSHVYNGVGLFDVSLIVTDVNGCRDTLTRDEYVRVRLPQAEFTVSSTDLCEGELATFTDASIPDTTLVSWTWDFGDGNTATGQGVQHLYATSGVYSVRLIVENVLGCTDTIIKNNVVQIADKPSASFTVSDTADCTPFAFTLTNTSVANTWPITGYEWIFGDGNTANTANASHTYQVSGTYELLLVATDQNGCTDTVRQSMLARALPVASFMTADSVGCSPRVVSFTNPSTGPAPLNGFIWDFGDGNTSTQQFPIHTYTSDGNYTISLEVEDIHGCRDTLVRNNYVRLSRPQADFTLSTAKACEGIQVDFNDASIADTSLTNWEWDFGDGNTATGPSVSHTYTASGTYTVSMILTNINGCSDTISKSSVIEVVERPQAAFAVSDTIGCNPFIATFTDQSLEGDTTLVAWSWDFGNGLTSTATTRTVIFSTPGDYQVSLIVADRLGCLDTTTRTVTSSAPPAADFDASTQVGCDENITFNDLSTSSRNIVSWKWYFGDGDSSDVQAPTHTYTLTGIYTVTLIVIDDLGCTDTIVKPDFINLIRPVAIFSQDRDEICPGGSITFFDFSVTGFPPVPNFPIVSRNWDFGDGNTGSGSVVNHTYTQPGTYTVTLTIVNTQGCTDTETRTVRVFEPPVAMVGASTLEGCVPHQINFSDLSTANGVAILTQDWDFGNGSRSTQANPSMTYTQAGDYTVSLSVVDGNGCTHDTSILVRIHENPSIDFEADRRFSCAPVNINFTSLAASGAGIVSWNWNFGDGNTSTLENPSHTYLNDGSYDVSLQVVDANGCTNSLVLNDLIQLTHPQADFSFNVNGACPEVLASFSDQSIGDTSIVSWTWDFGDGQSSNVQNPTHIYDIPGSYTVSLIIENVLGCTDTLVRNNIIQVNNGPQASFLPADTANCIPLALSFANSSTQGAVPIVSYDWDFGDGQSSTLVNPQITYSNAGVFNVRLIATDANGCTDTASSTVTARQLPQVSFTVSDSMGCAPKTINFFDQSLASAGIASWLWDFGDGSTSTNQFPGHTYAANGIYTVSLTITDFFGCSQTLVKPDFIQLGPPQVEFTLSPSEICPGTEVEFTDLSQTLANVVSWDWDLGDGTTSSLQNPRHTYHIPGMYTVSLTITDESGCVTTLSKVDTIEVFTPPVASFAPSDTASCPPLNTAFNNTSSNGASPILNWEWDLGNGGTSIFTNPVMNYPDPGVYDIELVVTDGNGCKDTSSRSVQVYQPPTAYFQASDSLGCSPTTINFQDQSNRGDGQLATWTWDFGDGQTGSGQFPSNSYANDGIYSVGLVIEDAFGCRDSIEKINHIRLSHPQAAFTLASNQVCPGTNISFIDNSIPDTTITDWFWDFGDGQSSTDQNPVHFYTAGGRYTVRLTVTNVLGCSNTITQNQLVEILDGPQAIFTPSALEGCAPLSINLIDNSIGASAPVVDWLWDLGNGDTSTAKNTATTFNTPGIYTISLTVTDNNGCQNTFTRDIQVFEGPQASFMSVDTLGCAPQASNFTDLSTGLRTINSWSWDFGDGNTSNQQFPVHTYNVQGDYDVQLIVVDIDGCRDTLIRPQYIRLTNPIANFSLDATEGCPGLEVNFNDLSSSDVSIVSWNWDFGDGGTSSVQNPSYIYQTPGTYSVRLTITNSKGCSETLLMANAVTVFSPPIADFNSSDSTGCVPFNLNFQDLSQGVSSPIDSWVWDFGTGDSAFVQEPAYVLTTPGLERIRLLVIDGNGCTDSISKLVRAIGSPIANFVSPDTFGCAPQDADFFDLSTDPLVNINSWSWDFGDGQTDNVQNPIHTYANDGVYTVTLEITNGIGCTDRISKTNYIRYDHPTADFEAAQAQACVGTAIQFNDLSIGDTTLVNWRWDFGDGSISVQQNPSHVYTAAGEYDVKLVITNVNGCQDSMVINDIVRIFPGPNADFLVSDTANCGPFTASFTDFSTSPVGLTSHQWFVNDTLRGQSQNFSYFMNMEGRIQVSLVVQDNNGCMDTMSQDLFVRPVPVAEFVISDTIGCAPTVISFTDETVDAIQTWNWDFGDGFSSNEQNPNHTYNQDGIYSVSLFVENFFGCSSSISKVNAINLDHPTADFIVEYEADCPPVIASFTAVSSSNWGIAKWDWNFGDGNTATTLDPVVDHPYGGAGLYDVSLTVTDSVGCSIQVQKPQFVEVYGDIIPQSVAIQKVNVIRGDQVEVSFSKHPFDEEFQGYTVYREIAGQGYVPVYNTQFINDTTFIDKGVDAEANSICYKVSVTNRCGNESLLAGTEAHCTVEAEALVLPNRIFLRWNPYRGWNEVTQYEIYRVEDYNPANVSFLGIVPGTQTEFEDDLDDCFNSVSYRVRAIGANPSQTSWSDTTMVLGEVTSQAEPTVMLRATVQDNRYAVLEWKEFEIPNVAIIYVEKSENGGTFTNYATLPSGKSKFEDLNTDVNESSYAYRVSAQDSCGSVTRLSNVGTTILLKAERVGGEVSLGWTAYESWRFGVDRYRIERFNEALNDWEVLDFVQGSQLGYLDQSGPLEQSKYCYRVVAIEQGGNEMLSYSNEVCLDYETAVYAASAFTPNGDGVNDVFKLEGFLVDNINWKVFSRWGLLIYEGNSLEDFWDGTYQGGQVAEGTYVYVAEGTGKNGLPFLIRGSVTLLR
ncbi:MAG: PKD domain-containing protein [Bacteroidia bacterium]|nr:PKD domain-containing protein [Bacteroidia bacterium]